jgi:hypothetical protein
MKKISCNFLIIVGLIMALGLVSTVSAAANDDKNKRPKNTGILSVKTSPVAYPVLVDGVQVGMSGIGAPAEFYLTPGNHKVEIQGANGKSYVKDLEIIKDRKNCVCLKMIENTITTPCPYRVNVSGSETVKEGDLITFSAIDDVNKSESPLKYVWTVFPATARITSGQGTPSITVDSTGFPAQDIRAEVDVSNGTYDEVCSQRIPVKTFVEKIPEIETPRPRDPEFFGGLVFRTFDYDKAVLDQYAIALQNRPDAQAYMIVYQGRDKKSANSDKMTKRSLDYLVKARGVDPRRVLVTSGGSRDKSQADLFLVPPGASQPVPSPR